MTHTDSTTPLAGRSPRRLWTSVRDDLRERRTAREARRTLERELASYTTGRDVDDLLGALRGDDADAEQIRSILTRNLQHRGSRLAS